MLTASTIAPKAVRRVSGGATTERHMAKLIQICASQNDLFGLDDDGMVHQYNFNTTTWMRLGRGRSDLGESSLAEDKTAIMRPKSHRAASKADAEPPVRR